MLIKDRQVWNDGKILWFEYVRINDYSTKPTSDGLKKLSKILDLNVEYISFKINFYLNN